MNCKKCNSPKTVTLRQKDYYCNECFMISTNHKFRACLGKSKVLTPNASVLVCLSGGVGSTVLIDLIQYGISLENTKKLRITPIFLHIFDNNENISIEYVLEQSKKYNLQIYVVHISEYLNIGHQLSEINCIPNTNPDRVKLYQSMLTSMTPTAAKDFLLKIKRSLFMRYAKQLQCNFVFTAETTNSLAINLLCNISVGRGSQVQNDIGFCDIRDGDVKILRPIKDITKEELEYYIIIKQLKSISKSNAHEKNSLQSVITLFVNNLQDSFPATISTVCKTADKIGDHNENQIQAKCILCESDLYTKDFKMSALEATNVSRTVSLRNKQIPSDPKVDLSSILQNNTCSAVFPFVHKYLCYGCSRNHSEMSQSNLPNHLPKEFYISQ